MGDIIRSLYTSPTTQGLNIVTVVDALSSLATLNLLIAAEIKYSKGIYDKDFATIVTVLMVIFGTVGLCLTICFYKAVRNQFSEGGVAVAYYRLWLLLKTLVYLVDLILILIHAPARMYGLPHFMVNSLAAFFFFFATLVIVINLFRGDSNY